MNDDKDKKPAEGEEERTVFIPAGGAPTPPETPPAEEPPAAAPEAPQAGEPPPTQPTFAASKEAARIKVGDVLNHIYEVKRFLARGGMGEVFEGCNIHTDERVAIKVMLPALAGDEKIIALFRKEAKTLTKLHHEALVEYRVLAQEPALHVLYIVTDFIDGANLGASLGTLKPSPEQLAELLRRLASGLGSAHKLGAVHRDLSPDNVILENDDISTPKIIDFGIAKDLDASAATIVGDSFAGKLNYVAPEQLGDFGRETGPWTDVYSLALVILAVAQGGNVDMSGSLVDAIDKRRKGPDISAIPREMQPLIAAMLRPDPKERLRSMSDVVAMLDGARIPGPTTIREELAEEGAGAPAGGRRSKPLLIVLAVLVGLAALLAGAWYLTGGNFGFGRDGGGGDRRGRAETARATIDAVVPSVPCTWLTIGELRDGEPIAVAMRGVAGNGASARQAIGRALASAGLADITLAFGDVAQILPAGCSALDAFRQIRADSGFRMGATEVRYEMTTQADGPYAGRAAANARVDLNLDDPDVDFALLGIEPSGAITVLLRSRAAFENALEGSEGGRPISDLGNNRYRLAIDLDHQGWSGLLLITGRGPFPPPLIAPEIGERGPDWRDQLLSAASNLGWRAEMVWFESVNREPDSAIPAATSGGDKP